MKPLAILAQNAGANTLGIIVEHAPSPRNVSLENASQIAREISLPMVMVTVNKSLDWLLHAAQVLEPHALQLHGDETPELVRDLTTHGLKVWTAINSLDANAPTRAAQMLDAGAQVLVIDARAQNQSGIVYGGTGQRSDWNFARQMTQNGARVLLAGGLDADNVAQAIRGVQPWGVDVISGVEAHKGVKDAAKVRAFVSVARENR